MDSHALLIPPAAAGSLGDEALLIVASRLLSSFGQHTQIGRWGHLDRRKSRGPVLPLRRGPRASILEGYDRLVVLGADVVDGTYGSGQPETMLGLLEAASRLGMPADLVSFSVSQRADQSILDRIAALNSVNVVVRDPESRRRFRKRTGVEVRSTADLAFALPYRARPKDPNCVRLGVNVSQLWAGRDRTRTPELAHMALECLKPRAAGRALHAVGLPHDRRGRLRRRDDWSTTRGLLDLLEREGVEVSIPPFSAGASLVKAEASICDMVVTGRMHLAIAALSAGVPTILLTYSDKAVGLQEICPAVRLVGNRLGDFDALLDAALREAPLLPDATSRLASLAIETLQR